MIWDIYVHRNRKDTSGRRYEKIKDDPFVSAQNMKLQMNSFFWTKDYILKALAFYLLNFHFTLKRNKKILV